MWGLQPVQGVTQDCPPIPIIASQVVFSLRSAPVLCPLEGQRLESTRINVAHAYPALLQSSSATLAVCGRYASFTSLQAEDRME